MPAVLDGEERRQGCIVREEKCEGSVTVGPPCLTLAAMLRIGFHTAYKHLFSTLGPLKVVPYHHGWWTA